MPAAKAIRTVKTRSEEIINEWVGQIARDQRLVWLKEVPEWRLRAFGLAVLSRLISRMEGTDGITSKHFRHLGHVRFRQWVPAPELVRCLQMLRRAVLASSDTGLVRGARFLHPDAAEFRARTHRFFDDFVQWLVWDC